MAVNPKNKKATATTMVLEGIENVGTWCLITSLLSVGQPNSQPNSQLTAVRPNENENVLFISAGIKLEV